MIELVSALPIAAAENNAINLLTKPFAADKTLGCSIVGSIFGFDLLNICFILLTTSFALVLSLVNVALLATLLNIFLIGGSNGRRNIRYSNSNQRRWF